MTFFTLDKKCAVLERIAQAPDLAALLDVFGAEIEASGLVDGYMINLRDASDDTLRSLKIRFTPEFRYLENTYHGYRISLNGDSRNTNVRAFHARGIARLNPEEGPESEKASLVRWKMEECVAIPMMRHDAADDMPIGTVLVMKQHGRVDSSMFTLVDELVAMFHAPLQTALKAAELRQFHERFQTAAAEHMRALEFVIEVNNLTDQNDIYEKFSSELFRQIGFECIGFFLLEDKLLKGRKVAVCSPEFESIRDEWMAFLSENHYKLESIGGGISHAFLKNASLMFRDVQDILHMPMSPNDTQTMKILKTPRTLLVLPIRYQEKAIGCLTFFTLSKTIDIPQGDLHFLEKLSSFLGAAIVNSQNFELSRAQNAELERLATHDVLTGLPNRALLRDRLNQGLARWRRNRTRATVAFVDMDHFKTINDTLGHSAGDRALLAVSTRLQRCLRQSDTIARFGGDEFVMVFEDGDNPMSPDGHLQVLQRVFDSLAEPLIEQGQQIAISCSIGFSRFPFDGDDVDTLLNAADAAMYLAKQLGRSNIQAYKPDMRTQAMERLAMEGKLRYAADQNELLLYYQPKADIRTGQIVGVEALVRWNHPELGMVPPATFIPIAEDSGLIVPIGDWILRTACAQALVWQQMGLSVPVAVNLSARQFQAPDIADRVAQAIKATGMDPRYLELELTESMSMGNPEKSIEIMNTFKALGITLTIDDFGTGYSNLSYLKRFPLDKLKLDQSFVREITQSPEALAISQAILSVAHSLHLSVVAEGVETPEQLQLLAQNECEEIQGYYFSRPLPADECTRFLLEGRQLLLPKAA